MVNPGTTWKKKNYVFYLIKTISTHTPINNSMRLKCMYDINENATTDEIFGSQASISSSQVDKNEVKDWLKAD